MNVGIEAKDNEHMGDLPRDENVLSCIVDGRDGRFLSTILLRLKVSYELRGCISYMHSLSLEGLTMHFSRDAA